LTRFDPFGAHFGLFLTYVDPILASLSKAMAYLVPFGQAEGTLRATKVCRRGHDVRGGAPFQGKGDRGF